MALRLGTSPRRDGWQRSRGESSYEPLRRTRKKVTLADYAAELAAGDQSARQPAHLLQRVLQLETARLLVDLAFWEYPAQRDAAAALNTLALNSDNTGVLGQHGTTRVADDSARKSRNILLPRRPVVGCTRTHTTPLFGLAETKSHGQTHAHTPNTRNIIRIIDCTKRVQKVRAQKE